MRPIRAGFASGYMTAEGATAELSNAAWVTPAIEPASSVLECLREIALLRSFALEELRSPQLRRWCPGGGQRESRQRGARTLQAHSRACPRVPPRLPPTTPLDWRRARRAPAIPSIGCTDRPSPR